MSEAGEPLGRRSVALFCASRAGSSPAYADAARRFGAACAERSVEIVYGGARVGLMGVAADAALAAGGRVVGVIPGLLVDLEVAHAGLTELHVVDSMARRKTDLLQRSGAVVCLPGGLGTYDELFEALTWNQLGLHPSRQPLPIGLLDVDGNWEPLLALLRATVERGFAGPEHLDALIVERDPERLLDRLVS